jgi:2'-5' RNA ligase
MRLFVALAIPTPVAQSIMLIQGGVPGTRWQTREQLHLTLRFIGEVENRDAAMLDDVLAGIEAPGFDLQLHGVGQFGNKQPHALWAAARANEALAHLQRKVARHL